MKKLFTMVEFYILLGCAVLPAIPLLPYIVISSWRNHVESLPAVLC